MNAAEMLLEVLPDRESAMKNAETNGITSPMLLAGAATE